MNEIEKLKTVMMAAAVEIQSHWDCHCDEDGYGPVNLMHRLEDGIASQYGYDAKTVVDMQVALDKALARIAELEQKCKDHEVFIAAAFEVHPNLDLDVERIGHKS